MKIKFNDHVFITLLTLLMGFSFIDAFASALWVNHHFAAEANPLMAALMDIDLSVFLYVKLSVTIFCGIFLWKFRQRRLTKYALVLCLSIYTYILYKHIMIAHQVFVFYGVVHTLKAG